MKADNYLEKLGIPFETVVQENPAKTCDEAANERGVKTSQIVKSLIVESAGEKLHVLLPGDRSLSEKKLGEEYRMVPPEESKKLTGFESGTVHPFSTELRHLVDERIFEKEKVSHTVGEKTQGLIIGANDFKSALESSDFEVEIMDLAVSTEEDIEELEKRGLGEDEAKFILENGFRSKFLELSSTFDPGRVLNLLKAYNREGLDPSGEATKILNRAEGQTHVQRIVEHLAEEGELPEQESFELEEEVSEVLEKNSEAVEDYRDGQDSAINYLIGQLMQRTKGKANAEQARQKILEELE